jgi:Cof subfamily protein (haloacid dehalogenase superfamily)
VLRLVATDLDGTLLRSDGSVSDRTCRALAAARAAGVVVVLVSGRPVHSLREAALLADVTGLAICSNGAIVYDLDQDEITRHTALAADTSLRLIHALREAVPGVCFAFVRGTGFACEPAYHQIAREVDHSPGYLAAAVLGDAVALCDRESTKLIARHPALSADDLLARVQGMALDGFEATHSGAPFVEMAAPGVTKAWALESLCADLGIAAHEVVAFGDAPNDLPMLRWAGRGIAIANGHLAVLAEADEVAPTNDEDGVAVVLERLLRTRREHQSGDRL